MNNLLELLIRFLSNTAWPMEKPKPYGLLHLSFLVLGLSLSIFLAIKLRNIKKKGFNRILMLCSLILFVLELYKHLFYAFYLNDGEYQWGICSFHLCSMPMYLCLLVSLVKDEQKKNAMLVFMSTFNFLGGFISFFEPSGLLHEYWTLTFHALIWHMLLVFIGLFIALNRNAFFDKQSFKNSIKLFMMLSLIAYLINIDVLYFTDQSTNMFFVGPLNSSLAVFSTISERFGWLVNTMIYIPVLCFGAWTVYSFFSSLRNKFLFRIN